MYQQMRQDLEFGLVLSIVNFFQAYNKHVYSQGFHGSQEDQLDLEDLVHP